MNYRQSIQRILRRTGLLSFVEILRFHLQKMRLHKENRRFRKKLPDFAPPPLDLLYEIGGRIRLSNYLQDGEASSSFLASRVCDLLKVKPNRLLDWGCGVACVVRHMPSLFPQSQGIFGSDYNSRMISWASAYIPEVTFMTNGLFPPLEFEPKSLNWIYGLSVVTHLSESSLNAWLAEFHRILETGGILTLTTNGTGCEALFSSQELQAYERPGVVIREGVEEGRKMFLAYHHPDFFRKTVSMDWDILDFVPKGMPITGQDLWWLRAK